MGIEITRQPKKQGRHYYLPDILILDHPLPFRVVACLGASQHGGGEEWPLGLMRGGASVSGADRAELGSRQLGPRAR